MVMPEAYRSPMMRPLYVTTNASVIALSGANASSIARATSDESIFLGHADVGSTSPIGHGVVAAGGRFAVTTLGANDTESAPIGSGTQP